MEQKYSGAVRSRCPAAQRPSLSTKRRREMEIRAGYEIVFSVQQRTPMILMLSVHPSRRGNLVTEDDLVLSPAIPRRQYCDIFGNICTRIVVPPGSLKLSTSFVIRDSGRPDETVLNAREHAVEELPDDVLVYLLGSRYVKALPL